MIKQTNILICSAILTEAAEPDNPCIENYHYHRTTTEYYRSEFNGKLPEYHAPDYLSTLKPGVCHYCGKPFKTDKFNGSMVGFLWTNPVTGETKVSPEEFGPGAMFYIEYLKGYMSRTWDNWPEDTLPLQVVTPGGEWMIDARARNCTMPEDKLHRCWCRHGEPPELTVDKNGLTCTAGAGSIQCGNYHGFLQNGYLT